MDHTQEFTSEVCDDISSPNAHSSTEDFKDSASDSGLESNHEHQDVPVSAFRAVQPSTVPDSTTPTLASTTLSTPLPSTQPNLLSLIAQFSASPLFLQLSQGLCAQQNNPNLFKSEPDLTKLSSIVIQPGLNTETSAASPVPRCKSSSSNSAHADEVSSSAANNSSSVCPSPAKKDREVLDYAERRRRNNDAARRSREMRRKREEDNRVKSAVLEEENAVLRAQIKQLSMELSQLTALILSRGTGAM